MVIRDIDKISNINWNKPIIITLPFAGGNSFSYKKICDFVNNNYNIICLELPGRGILSDNNLMDDFYEIVDFLLKKWLIPILSINSNLKYIIFGHSMGALLAFYLAHEIKNQNMKQPLKLILSGREAPSFEEKKLLYNLPSNIFWEEIKSMGGLPPDLLENDDIKKYFEPILRSDIKAIETIKHKKYSKLFVPLTVLYGSHEDINLDGLFLWRKETAYHVDFIKFEGGHFFIFEQAFQVSKILINSF